MLPYTRIGTNKVGLRRIDHANRSYGNLVITLQLIDLTYVESIWISEQFYTIVAIASYTLKRTLQWFFAIRKNAVAIPNHYYPTSFPDRLLLLHKDLLRVFDEVTPPLPEYERKNHAHGDPGRSEPQREPNRIRR
jgi:hypothetical protein